MIFNKDNYEFLMGMSIPKLINTLLPEVNTAFQEMVLNAKKEGIFIKLKSGYRSFDFQKRIWNRKYDNYIKKGYSPKSAINKVKEYSALPGTSRHHWGTDIDIIEENNLEEYELQPIFFEENQIFFRLHQWLNKNAHLYGFKLVYTKDSNRNGFNYEPWHYTYAPLSVSYLSTFLKIPIYQIKDVLQIQGKDFFSEAFLNKYIQENVLGINEELKVK